MSKRFPDTHIVKSTPYFCEFSNREGTKGLALSYLIKKMGIKKEEVLCIGDQNNDIELLEAGGTKVAMGNGTKELKEISDYITSTVEEDGFIKAIEHYRGRLCIE